MSRLIVHAQIPMSAAKWWETLRDPEYDSFMQKEVGALGNVELGELKIVPLAEAGKLGGTVVCPDGTVPRRKARLFIVVPIPMALQPLATSLLGDKPLYYDEDRIYLVRKGTGGAAPANYVDMLLEGTASPKNGEALPAEGWLSWGATLASATVSTWGWSDPAALAELENKEVVRPRCEHANEYYEIKWTMEPPILAGSVCCKGSVFIVPIGANECLMINDLFLSFNAVGAGGLVSQLISDNIKKMYTEIPRVAQKWLETHPK
eukprot:TRINITY_DN4333_c0_g1_i1.p1 TRINITY_DN4333_c0_g1~~TRINITY_DN4333_c0_g1_i1.p1  ORF type:complete len:277 (+),score=70.05 TRINITY_DN4333_c0_g1_i1:45-833(+)